MFSARWWYCVWYVIVDPTARSAESDIGERKTREVRTEPVKMVF